MLETHCMFVNEEGLLDLIHEGISGYSGWSSTNKTNHHNIAKILLKVVLNTIN
jgi:hypothetical protein